MSRTIFALVAALSIASSPALAIDFTKVLLDDDGCPFKDTVTSMRTDHTLGKPDCPQPPRGPDGVVPKYPDLTLGNAAYYALRGNFPDDQNLKIDEKLRRAELARRVRYAQDLTLTTDEIALIKTVVNKLWPVPIILAIVEMIAPGDLPRAGAKP